MVSAPFTGYVIRHNELQVVLKLDPSPLHSLVIPVKSAATTSSKLNLFVTFCNYEHQFIFRKLGCDTIRARICPDV